MYVPCMFLWMGSLESPIALQYNCGFTNVGQGPGGLEASWMHGEVGEGFPVMNTLNVV